LLENAPKARYDSLTMAEITPKFKQQPKEVIAHLVEATFCRYEPRIPIDGD
jgi:hypothetical protein